MYAEWTPQAAESWKLTLPCNRAEGEALAGGAPDLAELDPPLVLMTSEPDPARPDEWRLDIYLDRIPEADLLARIRALAPSAAATEPVIERLEDADWVTLSQGFLEPIRAGRFFVHTAAHADAIPADTVPFVVEAGRAFGTGHHETTTGCLEMLDRLADTGRNFTEIADIGSGTGLLAFAAQALWPNARILASDIDPIAIEVAFANVAANAIPPDAIALVVADGMEDPALAARAPYDLLVANILAGPLIALAPDFARATRTGSVVVLAGLLASQADAVLQVYATYGFVLLDRNDRGEWPTLALVAEVVQQA